jgi:hypothetical protein
MGKPGRGDALSLMPEYIGHEGQRRELKHLSTCRKGKRSDFLSSGERTGKSPNRVRVRPQPLRIRGRGNVCLPLVGGSESYKGRF